MEEEEEVEEEKVEVEENLIDFGDTVDDGGDLIGSFDPLGTHEPAPMIAQTKSIPQEKPSSGGGLLDLDDHP